MSDIYSIRMKIKLITILDLLIGFFMLLVFLPLALLGLHYYLVRLQYRNISFLFIILLFILCIFEFITALIGITSGYLLSKSKINGFRLSIWTLIMLIITLILISILIYINDFARGLTGLHFLVVAFQFIILIIVIIIFFIFTLIITKNRIIIEEYFSKINSNDAKM
ncbi:MAG: hypothetical protein ACFFHV_22905 [Promethearchaeota archaeon]